MNTTEQYTPGDTANGHILTTDGTWVPTHTPTKPKSRAGIYAAITAAIILALGGVGVAIAVAATDTPQTTVATAPVTPTDATGLTSAEQAFVLANEADFGSMDAATEVSYVSLGHTVCGALDSGADPVEVGLVAVDNGFTYEEGAALVVDSARYLCPSNMAVIDAAIDSGTDA